MSGKHILVVEDEKPIRDMVTFGLRRGGYEVTEAVDSRQAHARLAARPPDLILLDWMLPDASGLEFLRAVRRDAAFGQVPIIMLTARGGEDDKVRGLGSGADDYITKPFSHRELQARIEAVLRRGNQDAEAAESLRSGDIELDTASHRVHVRGEELALGPTEFRLLHYLMSRPERVHSRARLLDNVWGHNVYVEERTVDVHIRRLRRALTPSGCNRYIQTVRGAGYRFSVC